MGLERRAVSAYLIARLNRLERNYGILGHIIIFAMKCTYNAETRERAVATRVAMRVTMRGNLVALAAMLSGSETGPK
jgi:hypothetical protein